MAARLMRDRVSCCWSSASEGGSRWVAYPRRTCSRRDAAFVRRHATTPRPARDRACRGEVRTRIVKASYGTDDPVNDGGTGTVSESVPWRQAVVLIIVEDGTRGNVGHDFPVRKPVQLSNGGCPERCGNRQALPPKVTRPGGSHVGLRSAPPPSRPSTSAVDRERTRPVGRRSERDRGVGTLAGGPHAPSRAAPAPPTCRQTNWRPPENQG